MKIISAIREWYKGSSLETFNKKDTRKGDLAGAYCMLFVSLIVFMLLTVLPIVGFWSIVIMFKPSMVVYFDQIIIFSLFMSVPQLIFLWDMLMSDYYKKTGRKR